MKGTSNFKTDSLINVDEIVDRYMDSSKNGTTSVTKPGSRIWSEPMDDDNNFKRSINHAKTNSFSDHRTSSINRDKDQSYANIKSNKLFDDFDFEAKKTTLSINNKTNSIDRHLSSLRLTENFDFFKNDANNNDNKTKSVENGFKLFDDDAVISKMDDFNDILVNKLDEIETNIEQKKHTINLDNKSNKTEQFKQSPTSSFDNKHTINFTKTLIDDYVEPSKTIKFDNDDKKDSKTNTFKLNINEWSKTKKFTDILDDTNDSSMDFKTNKFDDIFDDLKTEKLTIDENVSGRNKTRTVIFQKTKKATTSASLNDDEYDKKINDSFNKDLTSQLLRFNENPSDISKVPQEQKQSSYTHIFFNDTGQLDLTKQINNNDQISFNTNKKFGEKKTKSLGFFKENAKRDAIKQAKLEAKNEAKIKKQKQKTLWNSLPGFYRFEYFIATITLIFSVLFFLSSIISLIYVVVQVFNFNQSQWLFLPQGLFNGFTLVILFFGILNFSNIKKEIKINNYHITNEVVTPFIKRKYRSLCSSYIVLNWTALTVYVVGGLLILMMYIVAYFHNLINAGINNFGYLTINGGDNVLNIILWSVVSLIIFFVLWQITSFIINHKRKSEIELFYQKDILTEEMIQKYKKSANRKGLAIFLVCTITISLSLLIIWLIFRKVSISNVFKK